MRGFFGVVVLALGVGALGWWARAEHAVDIEARIQAGADSVVTAAKHGVEASVSGRDITLTGTADTETDKTELIARLEGIDGLRVVRDMLDVLPAVSPYTFTASRSEQDAVFEGFAPDTAGIVALQVLFAEANGDVTMASGAPDGWVAAIKAGADAGSVLKSFELELQDSVLRLTGLAATPVEEVAARAALEGAPTRFRKDIAIELEDDGRPFALDVDFIRGEEAVAKGKLPVSMTAGSLAVLDASVALDGLEVARIPSQDGQWPAAASSFLKALASLRTGQLALEANEGAISGVGTRAEIAAARAALEALPDGYSAVVALEIFDDGIPMLLSVDAQDLSGISGKLPFATDPGMFGLDDFPEDQVSVAEIDAQSPDFLSLAVLGVDAVRSINTGRLLVEDGVPARLSLSGTVDFPSDIAALEARFADAVGMVSIDVTALDDGRPLSLSVTKAADLALMIDGKLPNTSELDFPDLQRAGVAMGPADFDEAAKIGLDALEALPSGELSIAEATLTLEGTGTRADIALALDRLATLPASFKAVTDLKPLDDGLPLGFTAEKTGETVLLFGKMPFGSEPAALGLDAFGEAMIVSQVDAKADDFIEASQAGLRALAALENGRLVVQDAAEAGEPPRITLSGGVSRAGLDQVNAAFGTLPEGIAPVIDVVFADDGTPMRLEAVRDGGQTRLTGKLPFGTRANDLGLDALPDAVNIAELDASDRDFIEATAAGLRALARLESGTLTSVDNADGTDITLIGIARTPVEADAARQDAQGAVVELTLLDDGSPPVFEISFDPAGGAVLTGKLPAGLPASEIAARLEIEVRNRSREGLVGDADIYSGQIAPLASWLPEVARLRAKYDAKGLAELTVAPAPGVDPELLAAGLEADTSRAPRIEAATLRTPGAERMNVLTGQSERFSGAAWLPVYTFVPSEERCNKESQAVLENTGVGFLTGSARLDARANRAINAIAGAALHCLSALPALQIEIGGHTDDQGEDAANLALSQQRAEAVASALKLRGIPESAMTARGFGEAQPVAANTTEEGRAANRRTTIEWSAPAASE
ncbi:MAG: OmpA family protein [Pseudomonadota bacterium]